MGDVYRIGGDEFVVIIEGKDVDGQAYQAKLTEEIEKSNHKAKVSLYDGFWLRVSES